MPCTPLPDDPARHDQLPAVRWTWQSGPLAGLPAQISTWYAPTNMPISVELLEKAQRPLRDRVLEFLKQNPEQAYSVVEVYGGVEGQDSSTTAIFLLVFNAHERARVLRPIEEALQALVRENLVRAALHQSTMYYAAVR